MGDVNLACVEVLSNLPAYFRPWDGDPLPDGLIGATILNFGAVAEPRAVHGGGLVIDYQRQGETERRRVVLASSDIAMWVEFPPAPPPASTSG